MTRALAFAFALVMSLSACALTLSSGPAHSGTKRPIAAGVTLGASSHAFRDGGGVFGARLVTAASDGLRIRSGILHAGLDWRAVPGYLTLEPGLDLGVGRPIAGDYSGLGAYCGASLNVKERLWGVDDSEPAFNVYAASLEIVLAPRIGAWMPPEDAGGGAMVLEWSIELGLRLALGSDLVSTAQGEIADADSRSDDSDGGVP